MNNCEHFPLFQITTVTTTVFVLVYYMTIIIKLTSGSYQFLDSGGKKRLIKDLIPFASWVIDVIDAWRALK